MALDPQIDPGVEDQLYADLGPSLADNEYPAPWPPPHWGDTGQDPSAPVQPDEQIAPGITGPVPAGPFTPAEIAAATPAGPDLTAPPPGPPPVDASLAGSPVDQPVPPPPDAATAMPAFGPQPEGTPQPSIVAAGPPAPPPPPGPVEMPYAAPPDAQLGPPPGPAIAGPVIPIAPEQLDLSETPTHESTVLGEYADHVLDIPDPALRSKAFTDLYTANPEEALRQKDLWEAKNRNDASAALYRESEQNAAKARANFEAWQTADAKTTAQMQQVNADVQRIANTKIDPGGGLSWWQKGAGILGAIVGGLYQGKTGAARNAGLDAYETVINRGIEAQKADLERQMQGAQMRKSLLGEEYARHGDMFRAQETVRMAMYEQAINKLQFEQQNYTAGGTTAMRIANDITELRQRQAATARTLQNEKFKQNLDQAKENRESALAISNIGKNQSEADKNEAEARKYLAKIGGGVGAGGLKSPDPNYPVQTPFFDPFTKEPVFGKRPLGGKGEDNKELAATDLALKTYKHVQDGWARLKAIGDKIEYHKSLGESVWDRFKSTDAAEYDAATHSLVVNLTKALGDKLTQGQIDEQGHRIPQRTSWLESRDVSKMIGDAQQESDQEFATDMNTIGVNADPIILHAQQHRAQVQPTPTEAADSAHAALAKNPNDKDLQRAAEVADMRMRDEVALDQKRRAAVDAVHAAPPDLPVLAVDATLPPDEVAAAKQANTAAERYAALYGKFAKQYGDTSYRKGLKPGELAVAELRNQRQLGDLALDVQAKRQQAEAARAEALAIPRRKAEQVQWERTVREQSNQTPAERRFGVAPRGE